MEIANTLFHSLTTGLGTAAALATVPGTLELLLLTGGACLRRRARRATTPASDRMAPMRLAVVVPAHDEEALIERCIASLRACGARNASFDVVVVADNCTDDTAARAERAGARVLVRTNAVERGKGFALRFAFDALWNEPYDAFVVVDADSVVAPTFIDEIARPLADGADAVQVPYGVLNGDASLRTRMMRIALLAFNRVRLQGRAAWGLSAGISGNGFALARPTLSAVPYDAASVVEDLEYHLRLVRAGYRVAYAGDTEVLADMPTGATAAGQQRARWEGGRLRMALDHALPLARDVVRGHRAALEPLLELLLLPLALHSTLLALCLLTPAGSVRLYAAAALAVLAAHVLTAVRSGGRTAQDLATLCAAPVYIAWKLAALPAVLHTSARHSRWIRTPRELGEGERA